MKTILIFTFFLAAVAYADNLEEVLAEMRKKEVECEAELGEPKNFMEKIKNNEDVGDITKAGKMALCINVKMGHMKDNGEVIKEKLRQHVAKLTDEEKRRRVITDLCTTQKGNTPEESAMEFVRCMKRLLDMPVGELPELIDDSVLAKNEKKN